MPLSAPQPRMTDANGNTLTFSPAVGGGWQIPSTPTPGILLHDNCNGTVIDTTNLWQSPVVANGGAMSQAGGSMIAAAGALASGFASITSIEFFNPSIGNINVGTLLNMEAAPTIGSNRGYGPATMKAGATAASPIQDGYVWEFDIDKTFGASIYSGGVRIRRTTINPLTGQPFWSAGQTLLPCNVVYQGLSVAFYFNTFLVPVLTVQLTQPSTLNLPVSFWSINDVTPPATVPTWSMQGISAFDAEGSATIFNGQTLSRQRSPSVFKNINAVATGATLWTPATGKRFRLMGYVLALSAAGVVTLTDSTPAVTCGGGIIPLGTTPQSSPPQGNGYLSGAVNSTIVATITGGGTLSGYLFGTEEQGV